MKSDTTATKLVSNPNLTVGDLFFTNILAERVRGYEHSPDFDLGLGRVGEDVSDFLTDLRWLVTSLDYSLMESPAATTVKSNLLSIPFHFQHPDIIPWYFRTAFRLARDKLGGAEKSSHGQSWKEYVELALMERNSKGVCYNANGTPIFTSEAHELEQRWPTERVRALAYPGAIEFMNGLFAANENLEAVIATEDIAPIARHIMRLMIDFEHPEQANERISFETYNTANNEEDSFLFYEICKRMDQGGKLMYVWDNKPEGRNILNLKRAFGDHRVIGLRVMEPGQKVDHQLEGATDIAVYRNFNSLVNLLPKVERFGGGIAS